MRVTTPTSARTALRPLILAVAIVTAILLLPNVAYAISAAQCQGGIVPPCAIKQSTTPPGLDCMLCTFGNIARIILGVTGSFALFMFVYGGFTLLSSGGSDERVTKGKTVIRNAVIGIFIVLMAGALINYGLDLLVKEEFQNVPEESSSLLLPRV